MSQSWSKITLTTMVNTWSCFALIGEESMTQQTHFKIPMPPDVRDWLDKAAPMAQRSRGAHVIFLLRQEMEKEKASGSVAKLAPDASQQ